MAGRWACHLIAAASQIVLLQGTCQELEKSYFRLTSTPDPATVRCGDGVSSTSQRVAIDTWVGSCAAPPGAAACSRGLWRCHVCVPVRPLNVPASLASACVMFLTPLLIAFVPLTQPLPRPIPCRPEPVLRKALERLIGLLRAREVGYFYALDQFKARHGLLLW